MSEQILYEDIKPPYCYHVFDDELSDEAKVAVLRIMQCINEDKSVSISSLAEEMGTDPFTTRKCIDKLAEQGMDLWKRDRYGNTTFHIERL